VQPKDIVKFSTALLILCLFASPSLAQKGEPKDRKRVERPGPRRPEDFLKAFDANKDGKVSRGEFDAGGRTSALNPEIREKIFKRLDKDDDGFISTKELKKMIPEHHHNPLAKADKNKDGRIDKVEFAEHPPFSEMPEEKRSRIFKRLDRNSDDFIDGRDDRRRNSRGGKKLPRIRIKGLDLDDNGTLSWAEFQNAPAVVALPEKERRSVFNRYDSNKDQEISSGEIRVHTDDRPPRSDKKPDPKK
jgi:Ca2+-binding EF-hand superfamily protein